MINKMNIVILTVLIITFGTMTNAFANSTNQTSSYSDLISLDVDDSSESIQLQSCLPSGVVAIRCGCWGYTQPGELLPTFACCSGYATPFACNGFVCPMGGMAWRSVCE